MLSIIIPFGKTTGVGKLKTVVLLDTSDVDRLINGSEATEVFPPSFNTKVAVDPVLVIII